jgi:NCS1 family nucleobase:cation symporter-1
VDFFFVRHGHYAITDIFRADGVYGAWGGRGLTAYLAGFAAEIPSWSGRRSRARPIRATSLHT